MKKLLLALGLSVFTGILFSQCTGKQSFINDNPNVITGNGIKKEEIKKISGYDEIEVRGHFDVILTEDKQGEIRIVAEENILPFIQVEKKNKKLVLSSIKPSKTILSYKKIYVYVPAEGINAIAIYGSGDIENKGYLRADNMNITIKGSGDIELHNLLTKHTNVTLVGSGDVKLNGRAHHATFMVKGSGDISAFDFIVENTEVKIYGYGDIKVHCKDSFTGYISGSGDIKVAGKPANIKKQKTGSGDISFL